MASRSGADFFPKLAVSGREQFFREITDYFSAISRIETAEFEIVGIKESAVSTAQFEIDIRYDLVAISEGYGTRAARGTLADPVGPSTKLSAGAPCDGRRPKKTLAARPANQFFIDVYCPGLRPDGVVQESTAARSRPLANRSGRGVRDRRPTATAVSAVGDFDNDGFDDLYVCQPAGLPNRLYRNPRRLETFEDVTEQSAVGVLDDTGLRPVLPTSKNKGVQDLLVVLRRRPPAVF